MTAKTWIITGASSGFGRALVDVALERGDSVLAVARRTDELERASAEQPALAVLREDVTASGAAERIVATAVHRFGRIDVLVNNAGRGYIGAAEETSIETLRASLELHVVAPAALVRAVLPRMRAAGSGTIVQLSSQGGRISFAGVGAYSAGKFGLEGLSEALAGEVAPFGTRVMIVEPSRFRTEFNTADALVMGEGSAAYTDVLGAVRADMRNADGVQEGDPVAAARIIADLVDSDDVPLRLPLGREAVERIGTGYRTGLAEVERLAELAASADFPDAAPSSRPV